MQFVNAQNLVKNLLELCIEAARRRVTLGEMSDAMEESFGRYKANIRTISGIYAMNANKNEYFEKAVALTQKIRRRGRKKTKNYGRKNGTRRSRSLVQK